MSKIVVHMIGNAHLDPVWLWNHQAGVDEALATAYSAVNLLEEFPEFVFTRSDTWFHQVVERYHPELFDRVKRLVAEGRWRIVGGWYIQPDCNLPTEYAFRKHIEIGLAYAREKFGVDVTIGYNPDSFGHAGTLPRILARAGYRGYVFMRPGEQEKELPGSTFRWQASDSSDHVIAYRITGTPYCVGQADLKDQILQTVEKSDASLGHVMCFYGVGDHGGGPTREQIEYVLKHKDTFDGLELKFSHPQAYFDAIAAQVDKLPTVVGELEYHAVGCYTALRRQKVEVRRSEHRLVQAESIAAQLPADVPADTASRLRTAWEDVLFAQFHDTYGGTCLKSAYGYIFDQLGRAKAVADDVMVTVTRRYARTLPPVELSEQRLAYAAILNTHDEVYDGYVEHEFFGLRDRLFRLVNARTGEPILAQAVPPESKSCGSQRMIIPVRLAPRELLVVAADPAPAGRIRSDVKAKRSGNANSHWQVSATQQGVVLKDLATGKVMKLTWLVLNDLSDTWSHGVTRYQDTVSGQFTRKRVLLEETGPVRATFTWIAKYKSSLLRVRARVYAGNPFVELVIDLFWAEQKSLLKMILDPSDRFTSRIDGMPGGAQPRPLDGQEYPLHDWTILRSANNAGLAVISPDTYALDVTPEQMRLTLVRGPRYSLHMDDVPAKQDPGQFSTDFIDQGEHSYRLLIRAGADLDPARLRTIATQLQQPPIHWDPPYRRNWP